MEDTYFEQRVLFAPRESLENLIKSTKFTKREIKLMYRNFKQDCPSGYVDVEVLREVLTRFFPYGNAYPYAKHVFRTLDFKRNGEISFKEFLMWLSQVSRGNMDEKLKWIFQLYDVNGDGFITKKELATIINSIYTLLGKKRNTADDKYIEEKTDRFFERFDLDGDGYISHNEFVSICQRDQLITETLGHFNTII